MNKMVSLTVAIFILNNILIWYQLNSQLVWEWAKGAKSMWLMALLGIPISLLFWWATKIGYAAFENLWAVRFIGFATSMITFPIMTYFYLGEVFLLKTYLCIVLALLIMLIQIIM